MALKEPKRSPNCCSSTAHSDTSVSVWHTCSIILYKAALKWARTEPRQSLMHWQATLLYKCWIFVKPERTTLSREQCHPHRRRTGNGPSYHSDLSSNRIRPRFALIATFALGWNNLGTMGAKAIAKALAQNSSLVELRLGMR